MHEGFKNMTNRSYDTPIAYTTGGDASKEASHPPFD